MLNRVVLEEWRNVEGYEGLYQVSNKGNVRSLDRRVWNGKVYYTKEGRVLKKSKTTTGYWKVELVKNKRRKSKKVHRLVAKAFIPKVEGKNIINHKDGDPLNNNVDNLEWCTQLENVRHAHETGLIKSNFTKYKEVIKKEYLQNENTNIMKLARKYKCSDASIRKYFKEEGIAIRGISHTMDVYKINRKKMVMYFDNGLCNKRIAKKFNTNTGLIATYRYKYKKGELKI